MSSAGSGSFGRSWSDTLRHHLGQDRIVPGEGARHKRRDYPAARLAIWVSTLRAKRADSPPSAVVFLPLPCNDKAVLGPWVNRVALPPNKHAPRRAAYGASRADTGRWSDQFIGLDW